MVRVTIIPILSDIERSRGLSEMTFLGKVKTLSRVFLVRNL